MRNYGEMKSHIIETYLNTMILNVSHLQKTSTDTAMAKMCPFTSDRHDLTHCKCVLKCCEKIPSLIIHVEEYTSAETSKYQNICFRVYILLLLCTVHVRRQLGEKQHVNCDQ